MARCMVTLCRAQALSAHMLSDSADAQPTGPERKVWDQVNEVLVEAMVVLEELQSYSGAGEAIRQVRLQ